MEIIWIVLISFMCLLVLWAFVNAERAWAKYAREMKHMDEQEPELARLRERLSAERQRLTERK